MFLRVFWSEFWPACIGTTNPKKHSFFSRSQETHIKIDKKHVFNMCLHTKMTPMEKILKRQNEWRPLFLGGFWGKKWKNVFFHFFMASFPTFAKKRVFVFFGEKSVLQKTEKNWFRTMRLLPLSKVFGFHKKNTEISLFFQKNHLSEHAFFDHFSNTLQKTRKNTKNTKNDFFKKHYLCSGSFLVHFSVLAVFTLFQKRSKFPINSWKSEIFWISLSFSHQGFIFEH